MVSIFFFLSLRVLEHQKVGNCCNRVFDKSNCHFFPHFLDRDSALYLFNLSLWSKSKELQMCVGNILEKRKHRNVHTILLSNHSLPWESRTVLLLKWNRKLKPKSLTFGDIFYRNRNKYWLFSMLCGIYIYVVIN